MAALVHLIAVPDRNGRFSGYYRCSLCMAEFRPNPKDRGELAKVFADHVRHAHPEQISARQDVNQVARDRE